ncbi:hypothetical protein B0H14DRAFT_2610121 [Mycena olivaceomarginata]|nr:hypothetical protein B0H14DRAFT_2610121 [Mycena olivaceomarginata]
MSPPPASDHKVFFFHVNSNWDSNSDGQPVSFLLLATLMLDTPTSSETKASGSPKEELESLVSLVAALSQMSLDIAKHCLDVQSVAAQILHPPAPPPTWVSGIARTPDELEAAHPATEDDDSQVLHVVTVGREPGLYATVAQSNYQVNGVPGAARLRMPGRVAALAYYRAKYAAHEVEKLVPAPDPAPAPSADV